MSKKLIEIASEIGFIRLTSTSGYGDGRVGV
jgi:hypothetical protein